MKTATRKKPTRKKPTRGTNGKPRSRKSAAYVDIPSLSIPLEQTPTGSTPAEDVRIEDLTTPAEREILERGNILDEIDGGRRQVVKVGAPLIHRMAQRSEEWQKIRLGIPTASDFSKLCTSVGKRSKSLEAFAMQLAAEKYAGQALGSWAGNVAMERGRFLEEDGLRAYQFSYAEEELDQVGFVTDGAISYGCSPDAMVGETGCCEVKCLTAEKHVAALLRFKEDGDAPPDYVQQTQGQILICGREWCDLIFYHPFLPMVVVRQFAIPAVATGILEGLAAVLAERDRILNVLGEQ